MTVKKKKKTIIIIGSVMLAALLLLVFLIAPYTVGIILYDSVFGVRYKTTDYLAFHLSDFGGLKADRHEFYSDAGQKLVGYRYYTEESEAKGVVVLAHGIGGGGQNSYMDVAYYFARNGYDVFAYDATGNDESEGEGVNGIPQGVADLSHAINYLNDIEEVKGLPVMLWGHSWGGYCVSAVLNYHPEVRAVATISGFNKSGDLIKSQGEQIVGGLIDFMMPYVNSIEAFKCGDYCSATALSGFENTDCGVFVAHSADDTTVPIEYGYEIYYKQYADNPRFEFVKYANKGHNAIIYSDEYVSYMNNFAAEMKSFFGADKTPSHSEISSYYSAHLDRSIYCNGINTELFDIILDFYNSYL